MTDTPSITTTSGRINDLDFTWLEAGDPAAPLALCLHGFPDVPEGWRPLLTALAGAGFHAVAPWARGYAPTAVPPDGISAIGGWVADALAFHEELGHGDPGIIIGHDWGALTTYGAAAMGGDRWRAVVTASVPPTATMAERLLDYDQVRAFWYQYVFLQPTAEAIVANDGFRFIAELWKLWSPGFDATAALPAVIDALREPANLTAALGTYRSMFDFALQTPEFLGHAASILSPHTQPTLYLHGTEDGCVPGLELDAVLAALPEGSQAAMVEGAGHFLQYEQPDEVTRRILDFVS